MFSETDEAQLEQVLSLRPEDRRALIEEAADVRDRARALTFAVRRQHRLDRLREAGTVIVEVPGGCAELHEGLVLHVRPHTHGGGERCAIRDVAGDTGLVELPPVLTSTFWPPAR